MTKNIKNISKSAHQRLLNIAIEASRPFNEFLQHFAAIKTTFDNRKTPIIVNPVVFDPSFSKDRDKIGQWKGFISKAKLGDVPEDFIEIVAQIRMFLEPLVAALGGEQEFHGTWKVPGPWV